MAVDVLRKMFVPTTGILVPQPVLASVAIVIAGWWAMIGPNAFGIPIVDRPRARVAWAVGFAASLAIILGSRSSPFLYFQF
jgi:hypothetical protein